MTSHAGTNAIVERDTGKVLTVRVSSVKGSRNGNFTFTITLADGDICRVSYIQR